MNRRGSLEWSLETVAKLVFYALILVAIIYMGVKLVEIFTHGEQDWRAKRNFRYLEDQIRLVEKDGEPRSVILQVPDRIGIVGFDADETGLAFTNDLTLSDACTDVKEKDLVVPPNLLKPKQCDSSACVCVLRFDYDRSLFGCALLRADVLQCMKLESLTVDDTSTTLSKIDIYTKSRDFWLDWDMKFTAKGDVVAISEDQNAKSYALRTDGSQLIITPATP